MTKAVPPLDFFLVRQIYNKIKNKSEESEHESSSSVNAYLPQSVRPVSVATISTIM